MSKIKNENLAGKQLTSSFGVLTFDGEGILTEPRDLHEDAVKALAGLKGFEVIVEEKKAVKVEEPKKEEKAPEKAPEEAEKPKEEEAEKPKRSSRKAKADA